MALMSGFTDASVPDMTGTTAVVTGANTGIGYETALVLAGRGARVLLACRSQDKAEAAMKRIRGETPGADVAFVPLDQASLASVAVAAEMIGEEPSLDLLINNAGIMMPPLQYTEDGFESQLGVNHFGTFALTGRLLPKLTDTEGSRVVITSSIAHKGGTIDWDDLAAEESYGAQTRYQQSKLANLMFHHELDRRLRADGSATISVACHPGVATTELGRHMPKIVQLATPLFSLVLNSPAQGAWPTLMAATSPDVEGGDYVGASKRGETAGPAKKVRATSLSRDPEQCRRLWELSIEMTEVDPGI